MADGDVLTIVTGHQAFTAPSSGPAELVTYQETTRLTNAQIKALPTTPVDLVAAVADSVLVPVGGIAISNFAGGDYTNVDPAAFVQFYNSLTQASSKTPAGNGTWLDQWGGSGGPRLVSYFAAPQMRTVGAFDYVQTVVSGDNVANNLDKPIRLYMDNAAAGVLTGGHAANYIDVTVWYVIVPVAAS